MIDPTTAGILVVVGMCLAKLFRVVWPTEATRLYHLRKLNFTRLLILSRAIDQVNLDLYEVGARLGTFPADLVAQYRKKVEEVILRKDELIKDLKEMNEDDK